MSSSYVVPAIRTLSPSLANADTAFGNLFQTVAVPADPNRQGSVATQAYVPNPHALVRHSLLQAATSVGGVIDMIPADYRHVLAEPIKAIANNAQRLATARTTLHKWQTQLASGMFPSFISSKVPAVQFTKGYEESSDGKALLAELKATNTSHQTALFTRVIRGKGDEVKFLEGSLSDSVVADTLRAVILTRFGTLERGAKIPNWGTDAEGVPVILTWEVNPLHQSICRQVLEDCVAHVHRCISIVDASVSQVEAKAKAKKVIHNTADAEMQDGTAGPSIQSLVDKSLNAAVKRLGISKVGCHDSNFTSHDNLTDSHSGPRNSKRRRLSSKESGKEVGRIQRTRPCEREGQSSCGQKEGTEETRFDGIYSTSIRSATCQAGLSKSFRRCSKGSCCGEESCEGGSWVSPSRANTYKLDTTLYAHDKSAHAGTNEYAGGSTFVDGIPSSIPDSWCDLPLPEAVRMVIMNTSIDIIEASRFRNYIHVGPGVSIPKEIEWDLSVGMKYLFYQPQRNSLIADAWKDFERRFKWRVHFLMEDDNKTYDPDYDVREPSKKAPPVLPFYIDCAIRQGRSFVYNEVRRIPEDGTLDDTYKPLGPKLNTIKKFLVDNDYVITATDKNLGIAVSERTWIIEKTLDCISNESEYKRLTDAEANAILDEKCRIIADLAKTADYFLDWKHGALSEFLAHRITEKGKEHHIPEFYGIPKIHKKPTKFRPILPCHSAIQNPAAKFCSKQLKPIVQSAPAIIHGTKDLAIKLSKLRYTPGRKVFLVAGDVVAYYPNIPLDKCLERVYELYYEHYWINDKDRDDSMSRREQDFFRQCLEVGNMKLITQFQKVKYQQLNGLAMGVADSPDLANLYGWFCERRNKVMENPDIAFYGRYIDDCFAIVYAENEHEALDIVKQCVVIDDCEITWDVGKALPFLDMLLYVDNDNTVQHMPYHKAMSHQERIPWISAHPFDVKRGTYIGEMSRLATLSSKMEHYSSAVKGLMALYWNRGYPVDLVRSWTRKYYDERRNNRLRTESRERPDVLVLKSEFNTTWNYFNAKELENTVLGYMRLWLLKAESREYSIDFPPTPQEWPTRDVPGRLSLKLVNDRNQEIEILDVQKTDILDRKIIVSRKKTFNLFDLANTWKKTVLEHLTGVSQALIPILSEVLITKFSYLALPLLLTFLISISDKKVLTWRRNPRYAVQRDLKRKLMIPKY